jgi:hypothetical protein
MAPAPVKEFAEYSTAFFAIAAPSATAESSELDSAEVLFQLSDVQSASELELAAVRRDAES